MSASSPPRSEAVPALAPGSGLVRAAVHLVHAPPFVVAGFVVPWQAGSWFAVGALGLGLAHVVTAGLLCFGREALSRHALRVTALLSLAVLVVVSFVAAGSALYLSELYQGLGKALAAGLFTIWAAIALFTLPIGVWGLCSVGFPGAARKRAGVFGLLVALAFGFGLLAIPPKARATEKVPVNASDAVQRALERVVRAYYAEHPSATSGAPGALAWNRAEPATCREPVLTSELTLLVTLVDETGSGAVGCVQAADAERLAERLGERLRSQRRVVSNVELDLVTAVQPLVRTERILDSLKVRPAKDGVCAGSRCLAPWQLVASGVFTHFKPIPGVPDARFGGSLDEMTSLFGDPPEAQLVRVEAVAFVGDASGFRRLERLRAARAPLSRAQLERAAERAERYITSHQGDDGIYSYALDPYSAEPSVPDVGNIARQAGTALVLCELGGGEALTSAVRALRALFVHERKGKGFRALSLRENVAQFGHSALPLSALLRCRRRSDLEPAFHDETDELAADLGRFLLFMQRPDGSFFEQVRLPDGVPQGESESLFGAGQGILALTLLEELSRAEPERGLPKADTLRAAVKRAMTHYADNHWPKPLRSLFFLEENWHCLAARDALRSHRHDAYERYCLDYVAFKSRFILDSTDVEDPALIGGYGLGPLFPLHVTPTAGFAEAASAAIAVKRARGLSTRDDEAVLSRALGFVLGQQWDEAACFACAGPGAVGGFSESAAAATIRVDYVQHALAALGHGGPLLKMP